MYFVLFQNFPHKNSKSYVNKSFKKIIFVVAVEKLNKFNKMLSFISTFCEIHIEHFAKIIKNDI